jgi:hypothetical protein
MIALKIISKIVSFGYLSQPQYLESLIPALLEKLGDNKVAIRQLSS